MTNNLLVVFILLNIANVIIQTIKSIATVKCGKTIAATVNAVAYGLYTIVTVYMLCDLPLASKAIIVAVCNLVGVWVVKYFEEKARKDKLWKVEATFRKSDNWELALFQLKEYGIPVNYIDVEKYIIVNCYCESKDLSEQTKHILERTNAKYFVTESKNL